MVQTSSTALHPVGHYIREWRMRRRISQLSFALDVDISQKHLSFVESGRSTPSREMVLRLVEQLNVPLRERNTILLAAGFAPIFPERSLDDPALKQARAAIDMALKGHEPYPAIAVDRHWTLIAANAVVPKLLALVRDESLLQPPVNVLRLSLAPGGLADHIDNLPEWRKHILHRLKRQLDHTADDALHRLMNELEAIPETTETAPKIGADNINGVVVPLYLRTPFGALSLFSTITVFGTPVDITLSELAIEAFFPADEATRQLLQRMAG